jgi:citrate synthase
MPDEELFVSAARAAAALGVSVTTLYAYVSRKKIRSQPVPGSRQRRYWKADIDRIRGVSSATPLARPGGLTRDTDITLITEQGPFYRGQSAVELSDTYDLEQTAGLLWRSSPQADFSEALPKDPPQLAALLKLLADSSTADRATALFPLIELHNPRAYDLSHEGMCRTGADVLRWLAALLVRAPRPSDEPLHLMVARSLGASAEMADLIRRMLVLSADHGFEPGTYAVRAVASTGVTPYRSVLTGLSVSTGRRTLSGRFESLARVLGEVEAAADPADPVVRRIREGEALPGFGSNLYARGDPRARAVLSRLDAMFGGDRDFQKLKRAITVAHEVRGLDPDFALTQVYIARKLGLEGGNSLFILGRAAGWIAHAIEQYQAGGVIREPSMYTGRLPLPA